MKAQPCWQAARAGRRGDLPCERPTLPAPPGGEDTAPGKVLLWHACLPACSVASVETGAETPFREGA